MRAILRIEPRLMRGLTLQSHSQNTPKRVSLERNSGDSRHNSLKYAWFVDQLTWNWWPPSRMLHARFVVGATPGDLVMKTHFFVLLLSLLAACGGPADPKALTEDGYRALGAGNFTTAVKSFDGALAALGDDTSSADWLRAKMGAIQARTHTDAPRAKDEFLKLAGSAPSRVTSKDYYLVAKSL